MKLTRTAKWCLALAILVLVDHWKLFYPSQYSLLTASEGVNQAYSWFNMWMRAVGQGSLPLWDPYALGGYAFPGEMQTAAFYPLYVILLLFRPDHFGLLSALEYHSVFLGAYVMSALFMFALVRELGLSRFAALVSGFAFTCGGFVEAAGWPHMLQSAIWLPLIALYLLRALPPAGGRALIRNSLFSGFFLGLSLLAGGLQVAMAQGIFVVSATVCYALAHRRSFGQSFRSATVVAITVFAASCVGAVQLLPSHLYSQHTLRWVGAMAFPSNAKLPYTYMTQSALSPAALFSVLFPSTEGVGSGETWTPYIGVLPFLFAALAVGKLWSNVRVRFLLGVAVAAFLYALAGASALHGVLYVVTPFLWLAREATRFLYLTTFSLCILAGYGLDYLCAAVNQDQLWSMLKRCFSYAIAACTAMFLLPVFFPKAGGFWQYFSLLLILMSCILLRFSISSSNLRMRPTFRILVIGLVFFDLNGFTWSASNKIETDRNGQDYLETLRSLRGAVNYLKAQSQPFRVKIFGDPPPNIGDAYGIESTSGGGVTLDTYAVNILGDSDLMNAEYFIRAASASEPGPIYQDEHWKIYKNPNAFPRFWVVHNFKQELSDAEMLNDVRTRHAELQQTAFVADRPAVQMKGAQGEAETVRMDAFSAGEIRLTVNARSPGLLVLSEIYYPEWQAFVNGRDTKILRTDEALRSVVIPAGQSSVRFIYRPYTVYIGALCSMLGFVVTAAALFWRSRQSV